MDKGKEEFLKEFGNDYGYPDGPKHIDEIRATEFKRLGDLVYLDHAGATLYSELQMEAVFKDLTTTVYGNPHSQSDSSLMTSDRIREARQQVLEYFNASPKDYKCIFTSGTTAALKIVGEAFPWSPESCFAYTMENHNSVLGIREYALDRGAATIAVDIEEPVNGWRISGRTSMPTKVSLHPVQMRNGSRLLEEKLRGTARNLFAFPSECNFSGVRFSLNLVNAIKQSPGRILEGSPFCRGRWLVLIDAAKGCATDPPDLSKYPADFVVVSFYKLFGYPTGLGALIVQNDAAKLLKKTYFSGGTVTASVADIDFVKRREGIEELFEDGTTSFLSITSIRHGFKILNSLTMSAILRHTASLTLYLKKKLFTLKHHNGVDVCMLYGRQCPKGANHEAGPTVTFNLRRHDRSWYGYHEVEKLATLSGIQLRTGCFCNPGACAKYLGLSHSDLLSNIEAGHVCWDDKDILQGKPTGAVRVSFGYMSTYEDAKKFIDFVTKYFVSSEGQPGCDFLLRIRSIPFLSEGIGRKHSAASYSLKSIIIYPIKSCGGFSVESWPLCSSGLQYDREWILRSSTGEILTQKKVPNMFLINTVIDLSQSLLFVESPYCQEKLQININSCSSHGGTQEFAINGQRYEVHVSNDRVNSWFSNAISRPCSLLRCSKPINQFSANNSSVDTCRDVETRLNFANEAQFLLISEASVSDLNKRLSSNVEEDRKAVIQVNPTRFRPNLVISGGDPYSEDGWKTLKIGDKHFKSLGGCNRCQMINFNIEAEDVQRSKEPLATLASYRRVKGRILFGILLRCESCNNEGQDSDRWIHVGEEVYPNSD